MIYLERIFIDMRKNNFIKYALAVCLLVGICMVAGCKKNDSDNKKYTNKYNNESTTTKSVTQNPTIPTTTLPAPDFELPTLIAENIDIEAGQTIDYIGNLTIKGADDTDISEINVDTSNVRPQAPGLYKAVYTVIFRGYPITKTIVVNVTAPKDASTPTYAAVPDGESVGSMTITLSSGATCLIPCTTKHFVTETNTVDTYSDKSGGTYRTSVLKVTFSDGEVIELETVYTRAVNGQ